MIIGIGSDLIDIRRIEKTLERFGERFVMRVFTEEERREIEAEIRSVRIAHEKMIRPASWRSADGVISWE